MGQAKKGPTSHWSRGDENSDRCVVIEWAAVGHGKTQDTCMLKGQKLKQWWLYTTTLPPPTTTTPPTKLLLLLLLLSLSLVLLLRNVEPMPIPNDPFGASLLLFLFHVSNEAGGWQAMHFAVSGGHIEATSMPGRPGEVWKYPGWSTRKLMIFYHPSYQEAVQTCCALCQISRVNWSLLTQSLTRFGSVLIWGALATRL